MVLSSLVRDQALFSYLLGRFLCSISELPGVVVTMGECWRSSETQSFYVLSGRGSRASLHPLRLAVDLQLFVDGVWQRQSEGYHALGVMWEALHPSCRWGGRFKSRPDGNHFELLRGAALVEGASGLPAGLRPVVAAAPSSRRSPGRRRSAGSSKS